MSDAVAVRGPSATATLRGIVADTVVGQPDAPFLRTLDGAICTYGDAGRRAVSLGTGLRRAGVSPGDRVAVQVEKSAFSVMLYLACLHAGAIYVPLNTGYTDDEVEYVVRDVQPALVVRDPRRGASPAGCPTLSADEHGRGTLVDLCDDDLVGAPIPDPSPAPGDTAAILYTSGTTGRPKGAVLSQANLASNALALVEVWQFTPRDVLLHALPLFHTHGLFVATNCVIAAGASLILLPRFELDGVFEGLGASSAFMGIPTFYTRLLADDRLTPTACSSVRLFTSGSAPLAAPVHEAFAERTGHAIVERYGMTETSILTSNPLGAERPGTVGLPIPGVDLRVRDADEGAAEDDADGVTRGAGAIEVRGPGVFAGYWGRPELRESEFTADGWFSTGDLGTIDPDGYLTIVGRSKDVIISGGFNVYPKEVEDVLASIDGVLESAVVGVADADLGERVVAVVVRRPDATFTEEALRARVREHLAGYKVPKSVHFADVLPRNAMGKVQKAVLRSELDGAQVS